MKRLSPFSVALILYLVCTNVAYGQDYQKVADATPWSWSEERASVVDSLLRFSKDYQVELIRHKNKYNFTIRLVDDGKELYAWEAHYRSVFSLSGDVLVYADFQSSRTGCSVVAYDLKKQKQLWKNDLKGLGPIPHTRYSNSVNLEISNEVARVFGNESAGKYLEFVDLKTGKTVGHRVYGKEGIHREMNHAEYLCTLYCHRPCNLKKGEPEGGKPVNGLVVNAEVVE